MRTRPFWTDLAPGDSVATWMDCGSATFGPRAIFSAYPIRCPGAVVNRRPSRRLQSHCGARRRFSGAQQLRLHTPRRGETVPAPCARLVHASSAATYGDGELGYNDDPSLAAARAARLQVRVLKACLRPVAITAATSSEVDRPAGGSACGHVGTQARHGSGSRGESPCAVGQLASLLGAPLLRPQIC